MALPTGRRGLSGMPGRELGKRIAVAAIGIPLAVAAIHTGGWLLGLVLALIAAGAATELYRLADRGAVRPFTGPGALAAAAFVLVATPAASVAGSAPALIGLLVALLLFVAAAAVWGRGVEGRPLSVVATTVFGAVFPSWTLAHILFLRHGLLSGLVGAPFGGPAVFAGTAWVGTALVVYAVGLTWLNDSAAYFAGHAWGRRKLIPAVSPGKTVVGAVAGVLTAVVLGAAYAAIVLEGWYRLPYGPVAGGVGGGLIAVAAQVGDLVESVFKREAGVKDSGRLLPGHGGVLDRFDALFFAVPAAYWYLAAILALGGRTP